MTTAAVLLASGLALVVIAIIAPGLGAVYGGLGVILIVAGGDLAGGAYLARKRSRRRRGGYLHRR